MTIRALRGTTISNYVSGVIAEHGWVVQGVERDRIHPPWAYTVGLTSMASPNSS